MNGIIIFSVLSQAEVHRGDRVGIAVVILVAVIDEDRVRIGHQVDVHDGMPIVVGMDGDVVGILLLLHPIVIAVIGVVVEFVFREPSVGQGIADDLIPARARLRRRGIEQQVHIASAGIPVHGPFLVVRAEVLIADIVIEGVVPGVRRFVEEDDHIVGFIFADRDGPGGIDGIIVRIVLIIRQAAHRRGRPRKLFLHKGVDGVRRLQLRGRIEIIASVGFGHQIVDLRRRGDGLRHIPAGIELHVVLDRLGAEEGMMVLIREPIGVGDLRAGVRPVPIEEGIGRAVFIVGAGGLIGREILAIGGDILVQAGAVLDLFKLDLHAIREIGAVEFHRVVIGSPLAEEGQRIAGHQQVLDFRGPVRLLHGVDQAGLVDLVGRFIGHDIGDRQSRIQIPAAEIVAVALGFPLRRGRVEKVTDLIVLDGLLEGLPEHDVVIRVGLLMGPVIVGDVISIPRMIDVETCLTINWAPRVRIRKCYRICREARPVFFDAVLFIFVV